MPPRRLDSRESSSRGDPNHVIATGLRTQCVAYEGILSLHSVNDDPTRGVAAQYRRVRNWASLAPDLWELFSFGSMHRNNYFAHLTCLRDATSERNLLSSARVWRLYLTVPCYRGLAGHAAIVPTALRLLGKRLAWIQDSRSWLPVCFPRWSHVAVQKVRSRATVPIRSAILRLTGSKSIAGHGSWPWFDRLLQVDSKIVTVMKALIEDDFALPDSMFDRAAVRGLWRSHVDGISDNTDQLCLLANFGLFRRQILGQAAPQST